MCIGQEKMAKGPEPMKEAVVTCLEMGLAGLWGLVLPSRELTYPPKNGILKMILLFPRWDMLISRRVSFQCIFSDG